MNESDSESYNSNTNNEIINENKTHKNSKDSSDDDGNDNHSKKSKKINEYFYK